MEPERRLPELDQYVGLWVAVKDGKVIAVASTSLELVDALHGKTAAGWRWARSSSTIRTETDRPNHDRRWLTLPEGASMVKFPYREEGNPPILRPTVDVRLAYGPTGESDYSRPHRYGLTPHGL